MDSTKLSMIMLRSNYLENLHGYEKIDCLAWWKLTMLRQRSNVLQRDSCQSVIKFHPNSIQSRVKQLKHVDELCLIWIRTSEVLKTLTNWQDFLYRAISLYNNIWAFPSAMENTYKMCCIEAFMWYVYRVTIKLWMPSVCNGRF